MSFMTELSCVDNYCIICICVGSNKKYIKPANYCYYLLFHAKAHLEIHLYSGKLVKTGHSIIYLYYILSALHIVFANASSTVIRIILNRATTNLTTSSVRVQRKDTNKGIIILRICKTLVSPSKGMWAVIFR